MKEIKELLQQLEQAYTNPRCIDREKAKKYYDVINNLEKTIDEALEYIRKEAGWYSDAGKFEFGLTQKETLELYNILIENKDEDYKTTYEAVVRG